MKASQLDESMNAIATAACKQPLPSLAIFDAGVSDVSRTRPYTQDDVNREMKVFRDMTELLMPGNTVAAFIDERCVRGDMNICFNTGFPFLIVPQSAEMLREPLREQATIDEREATFSKFTHAEVRGCLQFCLECPDLLLSLISFQQLLNAYLIELREKIGAINEGVASELEAFHRHWATANNLKRTLMMAIYMVFPNKGDAKSALFASDQQIVTQAFQFLTACNAFTVSRPPQSSASGEKLTFGCPAYPFLQEMIVQQGSLVRIIETLRNFMQPTHKTEFPLYIKDTVYKVMRSMMKAIIDFVTEMLQEPSYEKYQLLKRYTLHPETGELCIEMSENEDDE